jgi:flavin-dependent dehydrogenase
VEIGYEALMQRHISTDVLVIGGGTAGFGAALGAARQGARVRLIEGTSKIGGVMAFCPGMPWGGGYPTGRSIGGVFADLTDQLCAMQPPMAEVRPSTLENFGYEVIYDHEAAVFAMFQMLEDAGVDVHLNTFAGAPVIEEGQIRRIACTDRSGPMTIEAGMVIDCSGDGDLSARAGVPFMVGDGRGNMMGVTLSFSMLNAPWERVFAHGDPYLRPRPQRALPKGGSIPISPSST